MIKFINLTFLACLLHGAIASWDPRAPKQPMPTSNDDYVYLKVDVDKFCSGYIYFREIKKFHAK